MRERKLYKRTLRRPLGSCAPSSGKECKMDCSSLLAYLYRPFLDCSRQVLMSPSWRPSPTFAMPKSLAGLSPICIFCLQGVYSAFLLAVFCCPCSWP